MQEIYADRAIVIGLREIPPHGLDLNKYSVHSPTGP